MTERKGPVLIDLDDATTPPPNPAEAPPIPDREGEAATPAVLRAAALTRTRIGWLGRLFWGGLVALILAAAVDGVVTYATGVVASGSILGLTVLGLVLFVCAILLLLAIREGAALLRLRSVEETRMLAERARGEGSLAGAKAVAGQLHRLYRKRPELSWARAAVVERDGELFDADAVLDLAERSYMRDLDDLAVEEVRVATRQVAGATALIPLALADLIVALTANLRMIRRIAEVYGGRAGTLGSWRLFRAVAAHLIATGAVAVGDDLLGSIVGGGVLSRVSRRFGEGVVNGALTARVGVAAIEVCRPLPFAVRPRPSVTALVKTALTGMFNGREADG
ncbi:MAG: TIGR01620 family protein [Pseudomonadota bacterium]